MFNQENVTDTELAQAKLRAACERIRCERYLRAIGQYRRVPSVCKRCGGLGDVRLGHRAGCRKPY